MVQFSFVEDDMRQFTLRAFEAFIYVPTFSSPSTIRQRGSNKQHKQDIYNKIDKYCRQKMNLTTRNN